MQISIENKQLVYDLKSKFVILFKLPKNIFLLMGSLRKQKRRGRFLTKVFFYNKNFHSKSPIVVTTRL
jgi:hypothetical protein